MLESVTSAASAAVRALPPIGLPGIPLTPVQMGEALRAISGFAAKSSSPLDPVANAMRGPGARELTAGERTALQQAYGDTIDLSNVRIVDGPGWNPDAAFALNFKERPAITEGNTVYLRGSTYDRLGSDMSATAEGTELLVHEFAHVRQFQDLGFAQFGARYAREIIRHGEHGVYDYNSRRTEFRTETLEGQAAMAGDLARARWTLAHSGDAGERQAAQHEINALTPRMRGSGVYGL